MHKLILFISILIPTVATAQFAESRSASIRAMQMIINGSWDTPPVINLGSNDKIDFSFDELSHIYKRYTYRITHCNADWEPSELFTADYLDGFNNRPIEDWQNSENTTQQYTHYRFSLSNEDVSLKLSGNYKVEIFDDDADEEPVAIFGFAAVEHKVSINATVSSDTEIDRNSTHQKLSIIINHSGYNIQTPASDIKLTVTQNRRSDNKVTNIKPQYITGSTLEYSHMKELIFDAGNEYRRFEITDPYSPGMGVEHISYDQEFYHVDLYPEKETGSYFNHYDEDGRFFTNTLEGSGSAIEADYALVHFKLDTPYKSGGDYYLLGDWWGNKFRDSNIMTYDNEASAYVSTQLMKFGVYNYQYIWLPDDDTHAQTEPVEGNFYQTENEYLILVYHRTFGDRYDKLIGVKQIIYKD